MARNKNASITYAASKTEQERTAWNWVEENKPQFSFNAVLPNVNVSILFYFWREYFMSNRRQIGPILTTEISGSIMALVKNILNGDRTVIDLIRPRT
jgi:hypothetical protein